MNKDLELARQFLKSKDALYDKNTNLIELCEKTEKELNDNLIILKQKEPYRFFKREHKKWQKKVDLLESKANSIHKKLLQLYEDFSNHTNTDNKESKKKRAKENVVKS